MSEKRIEFGFTSALSRVDSTTGAWDSAGHDVLAKAIRGHIMSVPSGDGICGMNIVRYGMTVNYLDEVITFDEVVTAVKNAFEWAVSSLSEAFPIRGTKTPRLIVETSAPKAPRVIGMAITASLKTNLFAFPVDSEDGNRLRRSFASELLQFDGANGYTVYLDGVTLKIRTSITTVEAAQLHIHRLLTRHAQDKDSEFLPFTDGEMPEIDWSVEEITR